MDPHDAQGRELLRQPSCSAHPLNHRGSNISDISDFEDPYDPQGHLPLHGRESLVSMSSQHDQSAPPESTSNGHSYTAGSSWPASFPYSNSGANYAPVSAADGSAPRRLSTRLGRKLGHGGSLRGSVPARIDEGEEYDLSLLSSAAPMGSSSRYEIIPGDNVEEVEPAFDVTAGLGPMSQQDEAFIRKLQEQEQQGHLTRGLGQGFRPDFQLRGSELLAMPASPLERSLSRSFSRRISQKRPNRSSTIRSMGQDEANRRGEVIEVIMEEPADLSVMEGPSTLSLNSARESTLPSNEKKTETFYPQPNWKPFSMRWPYLIMLILLSVALAVSVEIMFQKYSKDPIAKFKSPQDLNQGLYFSVKFGPTLVAVVYGVLWQFTDFEVRRLEAYYQLSKSQGALAAESINVDYVSSFNFFRPFRALKLGHYAAAISSIATLLAISLVPTCAAASIILSPSREERMAHPEGQKTLHFSAVWSHLLTAILSLCGLCGIVLFFILQNRRSGLSADVRGIAGLASMAVVSHILMDFKDMDTAKHRDIHDKLKHHRYVLRNSSLAPDDENPVSTQHRDKYQEAHLPENPHPAMLRPVGSIPFIIGLLSFMGFIPVFLFTPANVITDKAPWVITALAVCLKLAWNSLETAVRMMEPFYILSRRHAPCKTLILDYTALPFGYMPIRALINGHLLVFLVGFGSIMTEFLTILVTVLATVDGQDFVAFIKQDEDGDMSLDDDRLIDSGQETVVSFNVSLSLSLFILLYMCLVALIVFIRRRHPFLPRQPNTIASVLAFIHQSKMLYDFVGTEKLGDKELVRRLEEGKTYGLGWFQGRDGQTHCGVDQEELISNYKHGIDFSQGITPWATRWDVL